MKKTAGILFLPDSPRSCPSSILTAVVALAVLVFRTIFGLVGGLIIRLVSLAVGLVGLIHFVGFVGFHVFLPVWRIWSADSQ